MYVANETTVMHQSIISPLRSVVTNVYTYRNGSVNQYDITKSNRFGYGSVFNPQYTSKDGVRGLSEPSGRWGCLVLGTRPQPGSTEESYCMVYYRANKDANALFPSPLAESYEYQDVAAVLNYYSDGVKKGQCPEYYPFINANGKQANAVAVDYKAVIRYLVLRLPELKKYTSAEAFIQVVFYSAGVLYKENATSVRPDVLWPKTADSTNPGNPIMNAWFEKRSDDLQSQQEKSVFSGVNDLLSNILTIAVIGGAIYLFAPMIVGRK